MKVDQSRQVRLNKMANLMTDALDNPDVLETLKSGSRDEIIEVFEKHGISENEMNLIINEDYLPLITAFPARHWWA